MAISQIGMTTAFSGRFNTLKEKKKKSILMIRLKTRQLIFLVSVFLKILLSAAAAVVTPCVTCS